jgi:hypothetical protein
MTNHSSRVIALRRYISLLRHEEMRLQRMNSSLTPTGFDPRAAGLKIAGAEKELRRLEGR